MSELEPNAPDGFVWLFLDIDIPYCRDLIRMYEKRDGAPMTNGECTALIMAQMGFSGARAKQIVDTIKGEIL